MNLIQKDFYNWTIEYDGIISRVKRTSLFNRLKSVFDVCTYITYLDEPSLDNDLVTTLVSGMNFLSDSILEIEHILTVNFNNEIEDLAMFSEQLDLYFYCREFIGTISFEDLDEKSSAMVSDLQKLTSNILDNIVNKKSVSTETYAKVDTVSKELYEYLGLNFESFEQIFSEISLVLELDKVE